MASLRLSDEFKNVLKQNIHELIENDKHVGILFSGGLDSLSCLLSLLELGFKPVLYTFHRYDYLSNDAHASIAVARKFNLKIRVVTIDYSNKAKLKNDILTIMKKYKAYHKTVIECIIPTLYFFRELENTESIYNEEKKITKMFTGYGADMLFGTEKNASISFRHNRNAIEFKIKRAKYIQSAMTSRFKNESVIGDFAIFSSVAKDYNNKTIVAPYLCRSMINFLLEQSWQELNIPYPKWMIIQGFRNWFRKYPFLKRHHEAMQTESRFRDLFIDLLDNNNDDNKSILRYYHQLYNNIWQHK